MRRAQLKGRGWISFGLEEAFLGIFFLQAAYRLHVSIPGWYWIVAVSETAEVARFTRSLSKAKQYQVVVLCQNTLGTDFIKPSCLLNQYKRWKWGWPQGQAPGWRFTPAEKQQLQPVCRQKGLPDHSKALWTTTACSQKNICYDSCLFFTTFMKWEILHISVNSWSK